MEVVTSLAQKMSQDQELIHNNSILNDNVLFQEAGLHASRPLKRSHPLIDLFETEQIYVDRLSGIVRVLFCGSCLCQIFTH